MRHLMSVIKKSSLRKVAKELGYKSHNSVGNWFRNGEIPERSIDTVVHFLKGKGVIK